MKDHKNGMIRNIKDLKEHSRMMEHISTNQNVKKSGKTPDPVQYRDLKDK